MKKGKLIIDHPEGSDTITVYFDLDKNGEVWMSASEIADAFGVFLAAVTSNIRVLFKNEEFYPREVSKENHFMHNGKEYITTYYNFDMILALAFRIKGFKAEEFRKWIREQIIEKASRSKVIRMTPRNRY
ncbi:MAG TPA: BRO family protein [Petrimonas sp.]|nr:BRO family protein [Petrimonas sp.]